MGMYDVRRLCSIECIVVLREQFCWFYNPTVKIVLGNNLSERAVANNNFWDY